jgi:hypothetical protein
MKNPLTGVQGVFFTLPVAPLRERYGLQKDNLRQNVCLSFYLFVARSVGVSQATGKLQLKTITL